MPYISLLILGITLRLISNKALNSDALTRRLVQSLDLSTTVSRHQEQPDQWTEIAKQMLAQLKRKSFCELVDQRGATLELGIESRSVIRLICPRKRSSAISSSVWWFNRSWCWRAQKRGLWSSYQLDVGYDGYSLPYKIEE